MNTGSFFKLWKEVLTTEQKKILTRLALQLFSEWFKNSVPFKLINTSTKQTLPKMPRNEAKIYQERILLSTEKPLLTSSDCFLTLASSLDAV